MSDGHQPQHTMPELPQPSQTLISQRRIDMALEQLLEGDANHTRAASTHRSSWTQILGRFVSQIGLPKRSINDCVNHEGCLRARHFSRAVMMQSEGHPIPSQLFCTGVLKMSDTNRLLPSNSLTPTTGRGEPFRHTQASFDYSGRRLKHTAEVNIRTPPQCPTFPDSHRESSGRGASPQAAPDPGRLWREPPALELLGCF